MKNFFTPGFIFKYLILTPRVKLIKYFDSHPPGCMRADLKNSTTIKWLRCVRAKIALQSCKRFEVRHCSRTKIMAKKRRREEESFFTDTEKIAVELRDIQVFCLTWFRFFFQTIWTSPLVKYFVSLLFVLLSVADKLQHKNIRCNSWRAARRARAPGKKNTWNAAVSKNCWQKKRSYGSHLCGNNAR